MALGLESGVAWRGSSADTGAAPSGPVAGELPATSEGSLVTLRNNLHTSPFEYPRPYVQACCKASLGLAYSGGDIVFTALTCGSWSCPHCRKVLAARTLNRLRRGMESREALRTFVTLTIDPSQFGAHPVGWADWDSAGNPCLPEHSARRSTLWSEPSRAQFAEAVKAMSAEFSALMKRLNRKASYRNLNKWGYFRVIELHRNGWPHYHVVLEHPTFTAGDIEQQLSGWSLGRVDARAISLEDAIGEVAPYLVCAENKAGGSKAYQFAARALPKNFRLYQPSQGFLAPQEQDEEREKPIETVVLKGYFMGHFESLRDYGSLFELAATTKIVLPSPAPAELPHKPPASFVATGDAAVMYFTELLNQKIAHAPEEIFRQFDKHVFRREKERDRAL